MSPDWAIACIWLAMLALGVLLGRFGRPRIPLSRLADPAPLPGETLDDHYATIPRDRPSYGDPDLDAWETEFARQNGPAYRVRKGRAYNADDL